MSKQTLVYFHLQKVMINHSHSCKLLRKRACEILTWIGIPKKLTDSALKIMREKKLIRRVNRDMIEIINYKKSKHIDKTLNEAIWEGMLK